MPAAARPDSAAGFALLDVLLAILIAALLAILVLPSIEAMSAGARLERAAFDIVSLLRADRNRALHGVPARSLVDIEGRTVRSEVGGRRVEISPAIAFRTTSSAALGAVVFYPDGTSSGGTFQLARGESVRLVSVDPRTAAISLSRTGVSEARQ